MPKNACSAVTQLDPASRSSSCCSARRTSGRCHGAGSSRLTHYAVSLFAQVECHVWRLQSALQAADACRVCGDASHDVGFIRKACGGQTEHTHSNHSMSLPGSGSLSLLLSTSTMLHSRMYKECRQSKGDTDSGVLLCYMSCGCAEGGHLLNSVQIPDHQPHSH
jgi:hypothetical protein